MKLIGTGVPVALSTGLPALAGYVAGTPLVAKFVQTLVPDTNAANVVIGGAEVTAPTLSPAVAGVGFPLPPGWSAQMFPPVADLRDFYHLEQMIVGIAVGDVLYVLYGG